MVSEMTSHYDFVIVGGGVVGLALAREVLRRRPGSQLLLLEKEDGPAMHQSGHNSGVIHSGLYYKPGSLKAHGAVAGTKALLEYCDSRGIPYDRCGKVIVALDDNERPALQALFERGQANGVSDLELIGSERLHELEPHVAGVAAIHSAGTGIVDFRQVAAALAKDIQAEGGETRFGNEVQALENRQLEVIVRTVHDEFATAKLITCAGLEADRLALLTGPVTDLRIIPFRGDYFTLHSDRRHLCRNLIYPVPNPRFPFLGVHFTRVMNGEVWAGPNAVLAFAREGYHRLDIDLRDLAEAFAWPGFRRLLKREWRTAFRELFMDFIKPLYVQLLQAYIPELIGGDLVAGPSGVRAQALTRDGKLVDDFCVLHHGRAVHVMNAPSPAATSCLVLAGIIANEAGIATDSALAV